MPEEIQSRLIEDEMKENYVDYAMSVIMSRALPDVNDGLKPVHRRILYTMYQLSLLHNKPYKKSANIVGNCMARWHPHGDAAIYDALARMAQDFSLRYKLVDGQGNWGCFTEDTKVALTDGRNLSFGELIDAYKKNKKNYTYTINKIGDIEIAEIKNPRLTKKNQSLIKVILDNNEEIKCTLNHKFMLRDRSYKEAKDLKPGDSLMPLYLKLSREKDKFKPALRNYVLVYQPKTNDWITCHNLADAWNLKNNIYKKSSGRIRHHINFNRLDNNPNNVKRIKWEDHWKLHAKHASELHKDENYRKKIAEGRRKYWANPKNKKAASKYLSERNKKNWMNPVYRKKMIEFLRRVNKEYIKKHPEKRKEYSKRATKILKRLWKDPDYRKMKSDSLKEKWKDPEYYKQQAKHMKKLSIKIWSNPKHRLYISNLNKKRWEDEEYKESMIKAYKDKWENDPEFRNYFLKILSDNGKKAHYCKFLIVCRKTIKLYNYLNEENYEKIRRSYNSKNGSGIIRFEVALKKFFNDDIEKLYDKLGIKTIKLNHTVKDIVFLNEKQDVYDLTIEETHNFALASGVFVHNSVDGDAPAAQRYTEARLTKIAEEMLEDIEKETVRFIPNYDGSLKEPIVLPSKVPNLLINGSSGIAVGMATNIPPHNISEVLDGIIAVINDLNINFDELIKIIKGPDFPTGAYVVGRSGILNYYRSGRGKFKIRSKTEVEKNKDREVIIVKELPYMVNKALLIESMADLVRDKVINGISDLRDESDRKGMRIVIELKKGENPEVVLNQLYKHTQMEISFGAIMLALIAGEPRVMSLRELIDHFITHRKRVILRRTKFDLDAAEKKAHILKGLQVALDNIDPVIKTIKGSKDPKIAASLLIEKFKLTQTQAQAILEMRLQRLTSLEQEKIKTEYDDLLKLIEELKSILASEQKVLEIIKKGCLELKSKYGDERKTIILDGGDEELDMEDLIQDEDVVITITNSGYVKRLPLDMYRQQKRGGTGSTATSTKEEDFVRDLFVTNTHSNVLFFSDKGRVYWLKAYTIPSGSRYTKGSAIINLLQLKEDEKISATIPIKDFDDKHYLIMATRDGRVKKTRLDEFSRQRKSGINAINLKEKDKLVSVKLTDGSKELIIASENGSAVRFNEKDVRDMGRTASGVRGIKLVKDKVVGMEVIEEGISLLTVTEKGYGKRTKVEDYRLTRRGGKGVRNIKITEKNGKVVGIKSVSDLDELIFITSKGILIRISAKSISVIGRNTQGVRVIKLRQNDKVMALARVLEDGNSESN